MLAPRASALEAEGVKKFGQTAKSFLFATIYIVVNFSTVKKFLTKLGHQFWVSNNAYNRQHCYRRLYFVMSVDYIVHLC